MRKKRGQRPKRTKKTSSFFYWLGTFLLIGGIALALYPQVQNWYYQWLQERELEAAEQISPGDAVPREMKNPREKPSMDPEENKGDYPEELLPEEGVLEIPELEVHLKIGYGVEPGDLQAGPGFYPESGYPDTGNVCIAGHRTTYGAPFRHLDELEGGEEIILHYQDHTYRYQVDRVFPTESNDWSVIDPTPEPALTLTTCHPPGSAAPRLILRAYLQEKTEEQ